MSTATTEQTRAVILSDETRKRLIALTKCTGKDKSRPVLTCVAFDDKNAYATDSYVLGIVPLEGGHPERQHEKPGKLVDGKALAKALKVDKGESVRLVFEDDTLIVEHGVDHPQQWEMVKNDKGQYERVVAVEAWWEQRGAIFRLPYYEGTYPALWHLIPEGVETPASGFFNQKQVDKVAALSDDEQPIVRLKQETELRPALVETPGGRLLGVVMPART